MGSSLLLFPIPILHFPVNQRRSLPAARSFNARRRASVGLARVAVDTAGNQVAAGIAAEAHTGHDVVEALQFTASAAEAVKAGAAFASVNGFAQLPGFPEVLGFERRGGDIPDRSHPQTHRRAISARANRADLLGQPHLHEMTVLVAFEHAQSPQLVEPAHRLARRSDGDIQSATQGRNRKLYAGLAYHEGMAQQMAVDGAPLDGQPETRSYGIFKLHPEQFDVHFFIWYWFES